MNTPVFIEQISSLDVNPDKQGGRLGAEVIVYPSRTQSGMSNQGSRGEREREWVVGGVKQGIGDPDGLPCAEHAPAQFKSPSTGSSLPQHLFNESWARKTGPETFEQALSITGPCYSVITGRSFCSGTQDSSQQLNTGGGG